MNKGLVIVLSGPSGVGKGTVCAALRAVSPNLVYSVSATTRPPRAGEQEGINYFYKTQEQFRHMIDNEELLEWAKYVDNYYGTPRTFVEQSIQSGKDVILEIDVKGANQVKERLPDAIFIFLLPPSLEELRNRIVARGTESQITIDSRMEVAIDEIKQLAQYDYAVVNDQIEAAAGRVQAIISAEHCRSHRALPQIQNWIDEVH